jgi:hypothetical protein
MKKVFGIFAIALLAVGFTSCERCGQCETTALGVTVTGDEICGDKDEIDDAKAACELIGGEWK